MIDNSPQERINKPLTFVVLLVVLVGGWFYLRQTPEECVRNKFLEWIQNNKEAFTSNTSDSNSNISLPNTDKSNPKEVTAKVKTIAKFPLLSSSSLKTGTIIISMRLILDQCGVDY